MKHIRIGDNAHMKIVNRKTYEMTNLEAVIDDLLHKAEQFELNKPMPVATSDPKTVVLSDENYAKLNVISETDRKYNPEMNEDQLCNAAIAFCIKYYHLRGTQLVECNRLLQQINELSIVHQNDTEQVQKAV